MSEEVRRQRLTRQLTALLERAPTDAEVEEQMRLAPAFIRYDRERRLLSRSARDQAEQPSHPRPTSHRGP